MTEYDRACASGDCGGGLEPGLGTRGLWVVLCVELVLGHGMSAVGL